MYLNEEAKEMVNIFQKIMHNPNSFNVMKAKKCAIACVDKILDIDCLDMSERQFNNHIEYYTSLKTEIKKL